MKHAPAKLDAKEWRYYPDAATSVLLWAQQQDLGGRGLHRYHQHQEVDKDQARMPCRGAVSRSLSTPALCRLAPLSPPPVRPDTPACTPPFSLSVAPSCHSDFRRVACVPLQADRAAAFAWLDKAKQRMRVHRASPSSALLVRASLDTTTPYVFPLPQCPLFWTTLTSAAPSAPSGPLQAGEAAAQTRFGHEVRVWRVGRAIDPRYIVCQSSQEMLHAPQPCRLRP